MNKDKLQDILNRVWHRDISADDAHDLIWAEPFENNTIHIKSEDYCTAYLKAWHALNALKYEGNGYAERMIQELPKPPKL